MIRNTKEWKNIDVECFNRISPRLWQESRKVLSPILTTMRSFKSLPDLLVARERESDLGGWGDMREVVRSTSRREAGRSTFRKVGRTDDTREEGWESHEGQRDLCYGGELVEEYHHHQLAESNRFYNKAVGWPPKTSHCCMCCLVFYRVYNFTHKGSSQKYVGWCIFLCSFLVLYAILPNYVIIKAPMGFTWKHFQWSLLFFEGEDSLKNIFYNVSSILLNFYGVPSIL